MNSKLFFILMFVIIGLAMWLSVSYYLDTFPGDFSKVQEHWGSFGSYFGGVVTPIVSLFSLLVVVFTVTLQKQILDAQRESFSTLSKLQLESNKQLKGQVDLQLKQSERDIFENKKSEMLNIIRLRIEQFSLTKKAKIRICEGETEIIETEGLLKNSDGNAVNMAKLEKLTNLNVELTDIDKSINEHLAVSMSILAFENKGEISLKQFFFDKMTEITPENNVA